MIRTAGSLKLGKVQVSVLVRSLLKSERPSGLTQAIIEVGRINKTLYLQFPLHQCPSDEASARRSCPRYACGQI
nr:Tn3 family transposase [Klebsiella pneumoniae]